VEHTKAKLGACLKKKWGSKVMLGQYMRSIYRQNISEENAFI
jgi:hypothetical protein